MKPANLWPQGGGKASYPPTMSERVDLESSGETVDADGMRTPTWSTFAADVPAAYMPLTGAEFVAADGEKGKTMVRFAIPWLDGVNHTMRLIHRGNVYAIRGVIPDKAMAFHLTLICDTGATGG